VPTTSSARFPCDFCHHAFSQERFLLDHVCERKRRFLQRDDPTVKYALEIYQRWYARSMARRRNPPSIDSFENSKLYSAFVAFARFLRDLNPSNPLDFVDFLAKMETPLSKWRNLAYYGTYIRERNKNEGPRAAIERNIVLMQEWANDADLDMAEFFRQVSPARATQWIISGRISPWLLFAATRAGDLTARLSEEQTSMVADAISADYWERMVIRHRTEVDDLRAMLMREYNI